jgi:hypothetical protein
MLDFYQILTMIYQILMMLASLLLSHSSDSLELLRQMVLTKESHLFGA